MCALAPAMCSVPDRDSLIYQIRIIFYTITVFSYVLQTVAPEAADTNGRSSSPGQDRVKAVAAKISAARELARRLAEERQTAAVAIQQASNEEAEKCVPRRT